MPKSTLSYALAARPLIIFAFSGATTTSSIYLSAGGSIANDGVPMPVAGTLKFLRVFDGSASYSDEDTIAFAAGDRLSVYCQTTGSNFTVKVRINGVSTTLQVTSVPHNSNLIASVGIFAHRA